MSTALRIFRTLPAADQQCRELVLGNIVFAPGAPSIARPDAPQSRAMPGAPSLAARARELERRITEDRGARVARRVQAARCLSAAQREAVLMVCEIVSQALKVDFEAVLGRSRRWPIARARMAAQRLCYERLGIPCVDISTVWRTTRAAVHHNCLRIEGFVLQDSPDGFAWRTAARAVELWCEQNGFARPELKPDARRTRAEHPERPPLLCDCGQPGRPNPSSHVIECARCREIESRYYHKVTERGPGFESALEARRALHPEEATP